MRTFEDSNLDALAFGTASSSDSCAVFFASCIERRPCRVTTLPRDRVKNHPFLRAFLLPCVYFFDQRRRCRTLAGERGYSVRI